MVKKSKRKALPQAIDLDFIAAERSTNLSPNSKGKKSDSRDPIF
jgi:hypothetical protein